MDSTLADETATLTLAIGGDHAAYGELVERYQEVAFRVAYLIVRDADAAEDIAQEAFIRAHRALPRFRPGEPFRPWLLRIVTNLALNEVRARRRRSGLLARLPVVAEATPDADSAGGDDGSRALVAAINALPLDDRVVLYLRFFLDLPEREIATAIQKPAGTVKSRLHRAGKRLRALIEAEYPELMENRTWMT